MSTAAALVLRWVDAYTRLAPLDARERRLAEMQSHVYESSVSGVSGRRLRTEAVVGAPSDLAWCDAVRRSVGVPGLLVSLTYSLEAATAAAVACVAVAFVLTLGPHAPVATRLVSAVAVLFPVVALLRRARARRRK